MIGYNQGLTNLAAMLLLCSAVRTEYATVTLFCLFL